MFGACVDPTRCCICDSVPNLGASSTPNELYFCGYVTLANDSMFPSPFAEPLEGRPLAARTFLSYSVRLSSLSSTLLYPGTLSSLSVKLLASDAEAITSFDFAPCCSYVTHESMFFLSAGPKVSFPFSSQGDAVIIEAQPLLSFASAAD